MSKLKITVLKRLDPNEIFDEFPVVKKDWMVPCPVFKDGQEFLLDELEMPEGFCKDAWNKLLCNARFCIWGGDLPFYDEKGTSVTPCADGIRPVIFKLERV